MPAKKQAVPAGKIAAQNVNVPGYTHMVDAEKYEAMRVVMMRVLPLKAPGLTQAEMWDTLAKRAPKKYFPDSGKVGWWMKTVQLDLEAKGLMKREPTKPIRWHRVR